MNRWGAVVGRTWDVGVSGAWGFEWRDGLFTPLPARPGYSYSSAQDINDFGAVLVHRGEGDIDSPTWRAALLIGDHEITSPLITDRRRPHRTDDVEVGRLTVGGGERRIGGHVVQVQLQRVRSGVGDARRVVHPSARAGALRLAITGTDTRSFKTWPAWPGSTST